MKALFAGLLVALLVGHLLRESPGYMAPDADGAWHGDLEHYVYWTRLVTRGGVQAAYGGTWPETYAVYPPVTLYGYQLLGAAYQRLQDPDFDPTRAQDSLWLRSGLKALALGWHLLAGLAIYLLLRKHRLAGWAAALYLANPAALYDVAHWGQPDGAHSLFAVVSIGLLLVGQDGFAWSSMSMAALAKPQAWSLLPLVLIATLASSRTGVRIGPGGSVFRQRAGALIADVAIALGVGVLVVLPFLLTGHVRDLIGLPSTISSVMPVVSADAHNLWWLVLAPHSEDALTLLDSQRVLGPLTFRALAGLLVLGALGASYWLYWTRRAGLAEAAALGALGWFVFTTQAHENHLFFALPLLALAWPDRRGLLVVFGVLSLTLLLNMVLHDQLVLESLGMDVEGRSVRAVRVFNAGLNVVTWVGWTAWAALRPLGSGERASPALPVREGHILHA